MTTQLGFNLDEETIEMFDSILLAISQDPELNEEFTKLKFIQVLKDKFDGSDGPIKQLMQKMAQLERAFIEMRVEHTNAQMDMKRAVSDMTSATRAIRAAAEAKNKEEKYQALKKLAGLDFRQGSYTLMPFSTSISS